MDAAAQADNIAAVVPVPPCYWWLKRIAVAVMVIAVLVAIVRWRWGVVAWRAYDAEIARIKAAGEPIFPEDFVLPPVPEERNAAPLLVKATQAINLSQEQTRLLKSAVSSNADLPRYLRELNELMAVTSAARALVREAGLLSEVDWGFPGPSVSGPVPKFQQYQNLGECVVLAARVGHLQGDDLEAIRSFEDALDLGAHLAQYRHLLPALLDLGMVNAVAEGIERIGPTLRIADSKFEESSSTSRPTRNQCLRLANRLLDDGPVREACLWGMYAERAFILSGARLVLDQGHALMGSSQTASWTEPLDRAYLFMIKPMYVLDTAQMLRQASDTWVNSAKVAIFSRVVFSSDKPRKRQGTDLAAHYLSGFLMPSFMDPRGEFFVMLARGRLAAVALAVRLYELDYGERPATLDALVPEYLPCLPTSPLLESDPVLHYEGEGDAPKVYFTGPDPKPGSRTAIYLDGRTVESQSTSRPASSAS